MTTKTANTSLVNTKKSSFTIPTLNVDSTVADFPANFWGYTLDDDVASPRSSAVYDKLVGAGSVPIPVLTTEGPGTSSQDVYFGAKADISKASGTYESTVVFNFVTGVINDPSDPTYDPNEPDNPVVPTNPSTPSTPNTPTYNPSTGRTTYTTVVPNTNEGTTTTTTEVSNGDTTSSYAGPHGVTNKNTTTTTTTETDNGSALVTGLAVASAVAGATGFIFFLVGKRRKDEDEEQTGGEQQPPIQY